MEQNLHDNDYSTDRRGCSNNDMQLLDEQDDSSAHTMNYEQHENNNNQVNSTTNVNNERGSTPRAVTTPSHEMLNPSLLREALTMPLVNSQNNDMYDADDSILPSGVQLDKVQYDDSVNPNESIIQHNNQPDGASRSTEGTTDTLPSCVRRNLPQLPAVIVPLTPHPTNLRALLLQKDNTMKPIIHLYGPSGSGLTTLANLVCQGYLINGKGELVQDSNKEMDKKYIGGIYWKNIDTTTSIGEVLSNSLPVLGISVEPDTNRVYLQTDQSPADKEARSILFILDDVTEDHLYQILTIEQYGNCNITFLVISTMRQHLDDCENYTIGYLDTWNAQTLLYKTAELDPKKVDINIDFKRGVKKLLALCDGHTFAIATFGAYISPIRDQKMPNTGIAGDNQRTEQTEEEKAVDILLTQIYEEKKQMNEKLEKMYFIINCLRKSDLSPFTKHHNGKTINLEKYLHESITCFSVVPKETIVKMALFPGGLCIPKHVLTWIWDTKMDGDTGYYIDCLNNNFLLSEEKNGSFSIQTLFYQLMLKQCDQQWLSARRREGWDYLFRESFGSFYWVKKTIEKMGIGKLQQDLQLFDKVGKNLAQAAKVTAYQVMLCDVWTVGDFTKKLDGYLNLLRAKLHELVAIIIEMLRNLNANTEVDYLEQADDLEVECNYIRNLNADTWESHEIYKTKASIIRDYFTFILFTKLQEEAAQDGRSVGCANNNYANDAIIPFAVPEDININNNGCNENTHMSNASPSAIGDVEEDEQLNTFGSHLISDDELTSQYALADQYLPRRIDNDQMIDEEDEQ
jgi:hypothetical protein